MIRKIPIKNLVSPNTPKGNEAFNVTGLEEVASAAGFIIASRTILTFEPGGWGGDHKHEREEFMTATHGNPTIIYLDGSGQRVEESMGPSEDGTLFAYHVEPWTPHLVVNNTGVAATLYELRNMESPNYVKLSGTPDSLRQL